MASRSPLFAGAKVEPVRAALHGVSGPAIAALDTSLQAALRGSLPATHAYVDAYRRLTVELLDQAGDELTWSDDREAVLIGGDDPGSRLVLDALVSAAAEAPFTSWSALYEADGVALDLVNRIRPWLGAATLAVPPMTAAGLGQVDEVATKRFLRRVRAYLNQVGEDPLLRLMEAWGLSLTELGGLFGVRRQAVSQWVTRGTVPPDRREKLTTLLALTDLLERKLKAGRLPGVARRATDAYGGESMLDLIRADRERELLELVRESFDWADAA
jgi:hypothetical protein